MVVLWGFVSGVDEVVVKPVVNDKLVKTTMIDGQANCLCTGNNCDQVDLFMNTDYLSEVLSCHRGIRTLYRPKGHIWREIVYLCRWIGNPY